MLLTQGLLGCALLGRRSACGAGSNRTRAGRAADARECEHETDGAGAINRQRTTHRGPEKGVRVASETHFHRLQFVSLLDPKFRHKRPVGTVNAAVSVNRALVNKAHVWTTVNRGYPSTCASRWNRSYSTLLFHLSTRRHQFKSTYTLSPIRGEPWQTSSRWKQPRKSSVQRRRKPPT